MTQQEFDYFVELMFDYNATKSNHLMELYMHAKFNKTFTRKEIMEAIMFYNKNCSRMIKIIEERE